MTQDAPLELSEEEMDALHQRFLAPTEEPLHDLACDGDDYVYQRGLRTAEEFQGDTEENGRRRHAAADGGGFGGKAMAMDTAKQASSVAAARPHNRFRLAGAQKLGLWHRAEDLLGP